MATYFISDLHLEPSRPQIDKALFEFLDNVKQDAEAIYLLGDFFNAWIGDDEDDPYFVSVLARLAEFTQSGIPTYFMHGNRDFLVGEKFAETTGITLLSDPTVVDLYGNNVLLMHGDSLCTDDKEYMAFRAQVRNPAWQQQALSFPLAQRRMMAAQLRDQSQSMNSNKAEDIMDVNQNEVEKVMQQHNVSVLIHGHTHRPDVHDLAVADKHAQRIVLGDWEAKGWYIKAQKDQIDLVDFAIS